MIASVQITNTENVTFKADLVFSLLSCKVLFTNRKKETKETVKKQATFLKNSKFQLKLYKIK